MKTLIVYCSHHGTTKKAVSVLQKNLNCETSLLDLREEKYDNVLHDADVVIIGGSIHIGNIQGKLKHFMRDNLFLLLEKKVGLFICCMREGEEARKQFEVAFPEELRSNAIASGLFGGEFLFSKMNFFEKLIVKKVSGVSTDTSKIDEAAMKTFADTVNQINLAKENSYKIDSH
ncbi:flavodoxin domain-containing protein [Evansella cellulosilytica]|uniref:Flavodoxin-like protein n=1 Tax=Evansella cellulosilytica (strain ATCC 21833 / DSM 2522 / FERM P-1141 / JCM 9156 / N-4) TaxID=649639 RepID=E6TYG8_EVAC2|nr:flavodoxin domain-containing protein [Evansella cellulosilytica]ADU28906.1 flavodoxin-like protein [Evansella cellulosilytica DSM 2522]